MNVETLCLIVHAFLQSPEWTTPIRTFRDEYCHLFEDCEENSHTQFRVFKDFQKMAENILMSRLDELSISLDDFEKAIQHGKDNAQFHEVLLNYLNSLDDYDAFKRLMVKRNVHLRALASNSVNNVSETQQSAPVHQNDQPGTFADWHKYEDEEEEFREAIRISLEFEKEQLRLLEREQKDLEEAMRLSLLDGQPANEVKELINFNNREIKEAKANIRKQCDVAGIEYPAEAALSPTRHTESDSTTRTAPSVPLSSLPPINSPPRIVQAHVSPSDSSLPPINNSPVRVLPRPAAPPPPEFGIKIPTSPVQEESTEPLSNKNLEERENERQRRLDAIKQQRDLIRISEKHKAEEDQLKFEAQMKVLEGTNSSANHSESENKSKNLISMLLKK